MAPYTDSSGLLGDTPTLRSRAGAEGYLCFRELVPGRIVLAVREEIAGLLARHGWIDEGTNPVDAITHREPRIEGQPAYFDVYDELQKLESFHTLAHHPAILGVFRTLFGEEVLVHARHIARLIFPGIVKHATPPHQDFIHIQGTPDTWTCWMPLGDCPRELGGLAILPRTHRDGILPTVPSLGAGGAGIPDEHLKGDWLYDDLPCGSFLTFHSHTVHRGMPNVTPDRMRLSVDFRYQPASRPTNAFSFEPHYARLTWEQIYAGWKSREFQYYWKRRELNTVPFDYRYFEPEKSKDRDTAKAY